MNKGNNNIENTLSKQTELEIQANKTLKNPAQVILFSGVDWMSDFTLTFPILHNNLVLASDLTLSLLDKPFVSKIIPEALDSRDKITISTTVKWKMIFIGIFLFPISLGVLLTFFLYRYRRQRLI